MKALLSDAAVRAAGLYLLVAAVFFELTQGVGTLLGEPPLRWSPSCAVRWIVFVVLTAVLIFIERRRGDSKFRYLYTVVDSADAAIVGADADGVITSWNRGAETLYGYSATEIKGRSSSLLHPPEKSGDFNFIVNQVRSGNTIEGYETIRRCKDGSTRPVSLIVSPIRTADGRVTGYSSIAHDISERRRAQKAVQMAEVGQLASGLVHEIRNPLNAMRMQIAVIQDSLSPTEMADLELARSQLSRLEGEVLRVQKLANDFLAYGRPSRDKPERIELADMLATVAEFVRPEFDRVQVKLQVDVPPDTASLAVWMDRDKLRQILVNVAENARQATPAGGQLRIACEHPAGKQVRILFEDTGRGVEPKNLPNIFDAFFSTKEEGTGLGLAIVKKTVESCGGSVGAVSEVGKGTCIEIKLPAAPPAETSDEPNSCPP